MIHSLRRVAMQREQATFAEHFSELSERITASEQRLTEQCSELVQRTANNLSAHFTEQLERTLGELSARTEVAHLTETVRAHTQALAELTALPGLFERLQQAMQAQMRTLVQQEVNTEQRRTSAPNSTRPKLSVVEANTEQRTRRTNTVESDKGAFVRCCLTETPTIRNADIQRKAAEQGLTISPAYISEIRKAFLSEQSA